MRLVISSGLTFLCSCTVSRANPKAGSYVVALAFSGGIFVFRVTRVYRSRSTSAFSLCPDMFFVCVGETKIGRLDSTVMIIRQFIWEKVRSS